jgi:hypothetical protein
MLFAKYVLFTGAFSLFAGTAACSPTTRGACST